MEKFLIVFTLTLCFGYIGAYSVLKFGKKMGLNDIPNYRSSHTETTPKGGGVGILIAFLFLLIILSIHWSIWITVCLISLISFWGDKIDVSPKLRLLLQIILSVIFITHTEIDKFLFFINQQNATYYISYFLVVLLALIIFQVGTANFYNFMDGINGIATVSGIIAFSNIGFVSWKFHHQVDISYLAIGIAFACLGFLPFNFPKSKVFMGDVGSVLLGFLFAGLIIIIAENIKDLVCYSSFLFLFYADEIVTMIERVKAKQSLMIPHRRHLYQVLVNEKKIDHWKVTSVYGIIQLSISIMMINIRQYSLITIGITLICLLTMFIIINNNIKNR
jgi:UDP-N-acetylmuramyl pentapeptide phosphotransferase/UDP-N-acetylglucosamine-1-phosphate transferase